MRYRFSTYSLFTIHYSSFIIHHSLILFSSHGWVFGVFSRGFRYVFAGDSGGGRKILQILTNFSKKGLTFSPTRGIIR